MRGRSGMIVGAVVAVFALASCATGTDSIDSLDGEWMTATPGEWEDPPAPPIGDCPWASEERPVATLQPDLDPAAATTATALESDRFWGLIESIPSAPTADDFTEAASQLAGCPLADIIAFESRLVLSLWTLDGPENATWFEQNDPLGLGFASDDTLLYARCATVLGGRDAWQRAVDEQTLEWGDDAPDLDGAGEYLLYLAWDAALAQGLTSEEFSELRETAIAISAETGGNAQRWGLG